MRKKKLSKYLFSVAKIVQTYMCIVTVESNVSAGIGAAWTLNYIPT